MQNYTYFLNPEVTFFEFYNLLTFFRPKILSSSPKILCNSKLKTSEAYPHPIAAFVLRPTYITKNLGASIGKIAIRRAYSPSLRKKVMLFSISFGYFER